jgi:concanavalin A-like lectin/glucanase superfamily protein
MYKELVRLGTLGLVLVIVLSTVVSAAIITDVVRTNGQTGDRDPVGRFTADRAPLETEAGGLMDGNLVYSDRTYPWSMTPADLVGSEYIRTYNTDKNGGTVDVTYEVTISEDALVWITTDDRIPAEWDNGGTVLSQQDAVDLVVAAFAAAGTFVDTGLDLFVHENDTTDRQMSVYAAALSAGTYVFGGQDSGKNYFTIGAMSLPVGEPVNPGTAGLVLYYDFEADVNDMSGNGNDGVLLGDANVMDGLLVLDGDDDAVAIARIGGDEAVYSQISYGMWIYPTADLTGLEFSGGMNTSPWSAGAVHMKANNGVINVGISGLDGGDLVGTTIIDPNTWSHMALTISETNVSLYLNGQLEDSRDLAAPLADLILGSATLGGWENGDVQREMAGFMDDVVVYDRGLSANEVQWLAGLRPIAVDPGSEGLAAYYSLDNDANDISGNGLDGTIMGDPELIAGAMGGAMEFDGDGDYIDCGNDASLDIPGPISLALWIRPDADDPEGNVTETAPMCKASSSASPSWSWQVRYGWNSPQPYMAFTFNTSPRAWAYVGQNLEQGEWAHIACSHDGETLTAYLNGTATESTPMGAIASSPAPILIGQDGWNSDWIGGIDEVMVYNRALSGGEIMFLAGYMPDVTALGDAVQGDPNDGDWPGAETPDLAIDDDTATKYLHFKGFSQSTGIQVTPAVGATIVTGLTFTTANDAVERDPVAFELLGSNDGIDGSYTLIASGDIVDFAQDEAWPRFTKNETPIVFNNTVAYTTYKILITAVRDAASANSMQIAEIELAGIAVD